MTYDSVLDTPTRIHKVYDSVVEAMGRLNAEMDWQTTHEGFAAWQARAVQLRDIRDALWAEYKREGG